MFESRIIEAETQEIKKNARYTSFFVGTCTNMSCSDNNNTNNINNGSIYHRYRDMLVAQHQVKGEDESLILLVAAVLFQVKVLL